MKKAKRSPSKKSTAAGNKYLEKAELFAYKFIELHGNATRAAEALFPDLTHGSASQCGSRYVRDPQVQEIISSYMDDRRKAFKNFVDSSEIHLTAVVTALVKRLTEDEDLTVRELIDLAETIARFAGLEISEGVMVAKANSRGIAAGLGRAQIPGVSPPGLQPGQPAGIDNRKTIFMLMPPAMPMNGVPTPALESQWREMGWKPGIDVSPLPAHVPGN